MQASPDFSEFGEKFIFHLLHKLRSMNIAFCVLHVLYSPLSHMHASAVEFVLLYIIFPPCFTQVSPMCTNQHVFPMQFQKYLQVS